MLKTIRIATLLTAVSAFAMPALAQTSDAIIPGSETAVEQNEAETRTNVAAESDVDLSQPANAVANPENETIVPGNEAQIELNEAAERETVAEGTAAETTDRTGAAGEEQLIPGSGATFAPENAADTERSVVQDEPNTGAVQ
ncbi:hypothetical protein U0C82_00115 [Fulvimarina sp. 2208YS6-2-32]|uniref:Uncharacterized protein n=1 Tax=Fulvimarina uroteuthidis TaxID=3098149 RepID=A0ABU5HWN0_9HYPH|nr:hypothetical protein [Fulvimarina sp. 2208YS6-2-32]MDY8107550.1 hypothetical protein [Fulvimarina sp. 2208YS6-2-32]